MENIEAGKNLTHSREEKFKTIFLKKDMTPMERQQDAELRKNLKEKREQEERDGGTRRSILDLVITDEPDMVSDLTDLGPLIPVITMPCYGSYQSHTYRLSRSDPFTTTRRRT